MEILAVLLGAAVLIGIGFAAIDLAGKAHARRSKRANRSAGAKAGWEKRRAARGDV